MLTIETIKSTKSEVEAFKDSMVWLDIVEELTDLNRRAQLEYDLVGEIRVDDDGNKIVPNSSETLIHLGDIKGRRKAVEYFLNIPDLLLQIIEDKKNASKGM